jgi:RimK family alpha-L-glutamate ligase
MPGAADRLRAAIVGQATGWHVRRLAAALAQAGHAVAVVPWQALGALITDGEERFGPDDIDGADVVVVRGMPGAVPAAAGGGVTEPRACERLEEVIFRMDVLGRVAARGTPVINAPAALEAAIDKYLSLARLAAAGLPVPRTVVAQVPADVMRGWEDLGRDCVVKPLFGSRGRDLERLRDPAEVTGWLAAREGRREVAYLQEYVAHPGWDARILIVGERWFAMRRHAPAGDWRTNVSRGGRPEAFTPPAAWVDLARRAAATLAAEVAGVDLAEAADGRIVILEVNAVPGWRALEAVTAADVTVAVGHHVAARAFALKNRP